ncbi:MAG: PCRF domain-containing protein [Clostridia bacterium]|nr:PCRF domain-containing protein [Clostridia bacterium]
MFENLEQVLLRYDELNAALLREDILTNHEKYAETMKKLSEIAPTAEKYLEYRNLRARLSDAEAMAEDKTDDAELRDLAREEAEDLIVPDVSCDIQGYDIDDIMVRMARENAKDAGVDDLIHFQRREVADLSHPGAYGFILTNPPYGERIGEAEELAMTYREFGDAFRDLSTWSAYVITAYPNAEHDFGRKADKKRKIYNGMIQSTFYQFEGPKPPKKHRIGDDGR